MRMEFWDFPFLGDPDFPNWLEKGIKNPRDFLKIIGTLKQNLGLS